MDFSTIDPSVWIILLGGVVVLILLAVLAVRMRVLRDDERTLRMHRVERGVAKDPLPNPPWYTGPPSFTSVPRPTVAQPPPQGMMYQPPLPPALNPQAVTPPHGIYTNMASPKADAPIEESASEQADAVADETNGETGPTVVVLADDQPRPIDKNPPSPMDSQADTQPYFVPGHTDYSSYHYDSLFPPPEPGEEHSLDDALGDDMLNNNPHP